ncbi:protoporphyrinogen oxidase [Nannochloropsis oceanica]
MSSSPASPVVKAVHSHANTSWQDKSTRHAKKIVVIGAGAAGLHAAARLRARGFTDISIFEAGCAVGGRCVSRVMYDGSVPVEAGFLANIVSEARNPLAELVNEYLAALDQKFAELLEHHDLLILIPVFVLCPVVFSQHFLLEIPALYGLWWYHPERVTALVDIRKGTLMPPRYTVLKCGWQALWARMVEIEGLDVHLNAKVKSIRRPCMSMKGKLVVEKKGGGRGGEGGGGKGGEAGGEGGERGQAGRNAVETYEFDFIVLAGSMKSIFPLLLDATNEEQELAEAATEFSLCSTIFEAEAVTGEQPVKLYPLSKGCAATGQVFAQINPRLFVHSSTAVAAASPRDEQQQEWDGDYDDKDVHGQSGSRSNSSSSSNCVASLPAAKEPRIVYQFLHRAPNPADFAVLTRRLKMHCDDQSFRELVMLKQCLWRFFPHFPNEDLLKKGWLWRLQEMQGQQGTLYLGASVCMDALNEVLLYNEVVLERILGD